MLSELHVKNLALIEKADLEFGQGLTVLSGETGAGKSILIDSINVALGGKAGKDIIRTGCDYAYVELLFTVDDEAKLKKIRELDIEPESDGTIIVSRKISQGRTTAKVNDETVSSAKLRSLTGLLIDMHGQFEHQSLMNADRHLEFVDRFAGTEELKANVADCYHEWQEIENVLNKGTDKALREREADILRYEIEEIENARLKPGEEEQLTEDFRRMKNAARISSLLSDAERELDYEGITHALKKVSDAAAYDSGLSDIKSQLGDVEDLLAEVTRSISAYADRMDFDESSFEETERRLDQIHRLQDKYGDDIDGIITEAEKKRERLNYLEDYDDKRDELIKKKHELEIKLDSLCAELSKKRKAAAEVLRTKIIEQLKDLNFLGVEFTIEFEKLRGYSESGTDAVQFMISTNPGNPVKPLKDIASGGELSRIMLALKTVLADTDETDTLVFDEIDAGISGKTARSVAEKLAIIGKRHQVLCITHLAQIASMADMHYLISKSTDGVSTKTDITEISGDSQIAELARLIGGVDTDTVVTAAREMKESADRQKEKLS